MKLSNNAAGDGVLIVTPTYNELQNIDVFVRDAFEVLPKAHILIVDDASPDGTGELADTLARRDARVHVLHRSQKAGIGGAYLAGFQWGLDRSYQVFIQMDADLSHDARYLPDFLDALREGADLVLGSRNIPGGGVEGWGLGRHVLSKGGSLYSRTILGLPVRDLTSGFKAFRRNVLETLPRGAIRSEGYSFQIELTYRTIQHGFFVREIPIVFVDRQTGQSKMSRAIFLEAIGVVWRLRAEGLRAEGLRHRAERD